MMTVVTQGRSDAHITAAVRERLDAGARVDEVATWLVGAHGDLHPVALMRILGDASSEDLETVSRLVHERLPGPARTRPGAEERRQAIKVALGGLAAGGDLGALVFDLRELHPRNNTFPGEVLLELAADAIEESGAGRGDPIDYEDIRERHLPEATFRGRNEHHRSHYALGAAAMIRAGVQPDLLGEIQWWGTDDLWEYALYALVVYVRIAAERTGQPVGEICARLAARHGMETAELAR